MQHPTEKPLKSENDQHKLNSLCTANHASLNLRVGVENDTDTTDTFSADGIA